MWMQPETYFNSEKVVHSDDERKESGVEGLGQREER